MVLAYVLTVGGIMGYVKSGSQKSLAVGGIAALLLYFVYTLLPVRPAFASSLGLGRPETLLRVLELDFSIAVSPDFSTDGILMLFC